MTVDATAEKLFAIITTEEFENAKNIKANGSLESVVGNVVKSDTSLEYISTTTDYERGITGVNKKKTEKSKYTYKWDLKAMSATWTMEHPMGKKVNITGTVKVLPKGDKSELQNTLNVEIKIPLVGKKVEKMIVKEIDEGWHKYEAVVKEFASK